MSSLFGSWYHPWAAALRIARRDAWRAKGRSVLVLSMIALPIVGVSAADLTLRSSELTTEQQLARQIGAADARFSETGLDGPILQHPDGRRYAPVGGYEKYRPAPEKKPSSLKDAIPAGAQVAEDGKSNIKVHSAHGLLMTELRELDVHSPLTRGLITLDRGRLPQGPGEVIATNTFLKESGLHVGSAATPRGSPPPTASSAPTSSRPACAPPSSWPSPGPCSPRWTGPCGPTREAGSTPAPPTWSRRVAKVSRGTPSWRPTPRAPWWTPAP